MELLLYYKKQPFKVLIDDEDFNKIKIFKWIINYNKTSKDYRIKSSIENGKFSLHRLIMDAKKGEYIDHINHNTLDNRKNNLRKCTNQENGFNRKIGKNNKSGVKGVYWDKQKKKWRATIGYNYKHIYLGYYENLEEAKNIYNKKAKELYKNFACI
jgi:hypothetical protein